MKYHLDNMSEAQFIQTEGRQFLLEAVSVLRTILRPEELKEENAGSPVGILRIIDSKLRENNFYLAVLGQFKRGKSTFINAILEDEILPTAVVPLTSVVTTIYYAPEVNVEVTYKTGRKAKILPEQLQEIVTERGNPGNYLGVNFVTIGHPSLFLKEGLVLVDTPGVGSSQEANTAETLAYLPQVDAALFLLSVDQPINVAEIDFIKLSASFTPKLYFVLNKIDLLGADELAELLTYCRKTLAEHFSEVLLYPVSSRWHLEGRKGESGIYALAADLQESLWKKRESLGLQGNILRLKRCLEILKEKNSLEKKAVMASRQQLAESIEALKHLERQVKQAKEDFRHILDGETHRVLQDLENLVDRHREEKSPELPNEIRRKYTNQGAAKKEIEAYAFQRLYEELELWRPEITALFVQKTKQLLKRLAVQAEMLATDVIKAGGDVLGVAISSQLPEPQWSEESTLEYCIETEGGLFLVPLKLEHFFATLPWWLRKAFILKKVCDNLEILFDRNCSRIRSSISLQLNKTTEEYFKIWKAELNRIVSVISDALEQGIRLQNDQGNKVTWEKEMNRRENVIRNIENKLSGLSIEGLSMEESSSGGISR